MNNYIQKIYDTLLNINDFNSLLEYKSKLETQPFCGVENCYDLEKIVFNILDNNQKDKILNHIKNLSVSVKQTYHIFTSFEYYKSMPNYIKIFLNDNYNYITILSSNTEIAEILYRSSNKKISMISNLTIDTKYVEYRDKIIADLLIMSINNYIKIFPSFIPIFLDRYNNITKLVKEKIEITILENSDFKTNSELLKIFEKLL